MVQETVSLEVAKRTKEAGFYQGLTRNYYDAGRRPAVVFSRETTPIGPGDIADLVEAPTLAELFAFRGPNGEVLYLVSHDNTQFTATARAKGDIRFFGYANNPTDAAGLALYKALEAGRKK